MTIATNMAGRGTDIVLGGNLVARLRDLASEDETDRQNEKAAWQIDHESRRIDNQLRGRAGRQGDPGSSKFYLSLEDNLMRIFASERMASMMQRLGMKEDEAIEHRMVSNAIENAQRKVEAHNFDARKQLIEYDDVANEQLVDNYIPADAMLSEWDKTGLQNAVLADTGYELDVDAMIADNPQLTAEDIKDHLSEHLANTYQAKMEQVDDEWRKGFERVITLQVLDGKWREHLKAMDYLRQSIGLRASRAQKDPRQEYKREAFYMFEGLLDQVAEESTRFFSQVQFQEQPTPVETLQKNAQVEHTEGEHRHVNLLHSENNYDEVEDTSNHPYAGTHRNAKCPCGSGKKFKHCHGKL